MEDMNFNKFMELKEAKQKASMDEEFILKSLADKDINAYIDKGTVYVDPTDTKEAKSILKKIGHPEMKVGKATNEGAATEPKVDEFSDGITLVEGKDPKAVVQGLGNDLQRALDMLTKSGVKLTKANGGTLLQNIQKSMAKGAYL